MGGQRFGAEIVAGRVKCFGGQIGARFAQHIGHRRCTGVHGLHFYRRLLHHGIFVALNLHRSQQRGDIVFDAAPQAFKHGKCFALVFLLGIFLCVAAQMDALTQIIHGRQMFAPVAVDHLQHHIALKAAHGLLAHHGHFFSIFLLHLGDQARFDFLVIQRVFCFQPALDIGMHSEFAGKLRFQCRQIPLLFHAVGRHVQIDQVAHHIFADVFGQIGHFFAGQDFVALMVDHFALVVGHVVVFQHLFAHIEVAAFHFALCAFNLAGEQAVLDGHAALRCQAVENGGGAVECKQTQERVFK